MSNLEDWEKRIKSLSRRVYCIYREMIPADTDEEDIAQQLRICFCRASERCEQPEYINRSLHNEATNIIQNFYRKLPKERGVVLTRASEETLETIVDPNDYIAEIETKEHVSQILEHINSIMKQRFYVKKGEVRKGIDEKEIYLAILSNKYSNDKEISNVLKVDWVKVGEVRQMMRAAYCLLTNSNIWNYTREINIISVLKKVKKRLQERGIPTCDIKSVVPKLDAIERYKRIYKKNVNREQLERLLSKKGYSR